MHMLSSHMTAINIAMKACCCNADQNVCLTGRIEAEATRATKFQCARLNFLLSRPVPAADQGTCYRSTQSFLSCMYVNFSFARLTKCFLLIFVAKPTLLDKSHFRSAPHQTLKNLVDFQYLECGMSESARFVVIQRDLQLKCSAI